MNTLVGQMSTLRSISILATMLLFARNLGMEAKTMYTELKAEYTQKLGQYSSGERVVEAFVVFLIGGLLIVFYAPINTTILASGASGNANLTGLNRTMATFLFTILIIVVIGVGIALLAKAFRDV